MKATKYDQTNGSIQLVVKKKEFSVYAQTGGVLSTSQVTVGQHVKKGDLIGTLSNDILDKQIAFLEGISDNSSAAVQLAQLQVEKESQTLIAPTDGVIASTATQGEAINNSQKVAAIFSDDAVQLVGRFNYASYNLFQQNNSVLTTKSLKDNRTYSISYGGAFQEISFGENKDSYVSLFFTFNNPNDAINVLQGEQMSFKLIDKQGHSKPIDAIINLYKNSIFNTKE
jgi:multidrug efflux pump subunit AcrA (membrane-fusion protein)